MKAQAVHKTLLWRWRAKRLGYFLLGAGAMVVGCVLLPWILIFVLEWLGLTPERGRVFVR